MRLGPGITFRKSPNSLALLEIRINWLFIICRNQYLASYLSFISCDVDVPTYVHVDVINMQPRQYNKQQWDD